MAGAYSDDLRQKFYEAYQRGDGSLVKLARRFGVSRSWAERLNRAVRETGKVERPPGGKRGPASKLTPELREQIGGWIRQQPDLTLAGIQLRLWNQHGLKISVPRLGAVLREMELRYKKNPSMPPSKTRWKGRSGVSSGGSKPARSTRKS